MSNVEEPLVDGSEEEARLNHIALAFVALVEQRLAGFNAPAGYHQRILIGGFLARAASLLREIDILRRHGGGPGAPILLRTIFEADLLCLYTALGGEKELRAVVGEFRRNVENLHERNPEAEYSSVELEWAFERKTLKLEEVARQLGPMLSKAGDPSGDAMGVYNSLFRPASTFDAHGMGGTIRHVDASDEHVWRVEAVPASIGLSAATCLQLGTFYTAWVAQWAFPVIHVVAEPAISVANELATAMDERLPGGAAT